MKQKTTRILGYFSIPLSILFWILVWYLASSGFGKPLLFPTPSQVIGALVGLMKTKEFYATVGRSVGSVFLGVLIAVAIGIALAFLTHSVRFFRALLLPLMTVIKATPVASFIILALLWIGSSRVPALITVLIVLPVIWTNLDTGFEKIDPKLSEMTVAFRMSPWARLRYLTVPSLLPYFSSACRTALGIAWKAGIAAEVIAGPDGTIGSAMGEAKQYIQSASMFAWTLTVILISLLIEYLFSYLISLPQRRGRDKEVSGNASV